MNGMKTIALCLGVAVGLASAAVPEYFHVLSRQLPPFEEIQYDGASSSGTAWIPTEEDVSNGFGFAVEGISTVPAGNYIWKTSKPLHAIRLFAGREEARSVLLAIRGLKDGVTVSLKGGDLRCGDDMLSADTVLFQRIFFVAQPQHGQPSQYLVPVDEIALRNGKTTFVLCTFFAPQDTPAGLYEGNVYLNGIPVPVSFRVLNGTIVPDAKYGFYLPGHFYEPERSSDSTFRSYVGPTFTPDNLENWVKFNKTRGINSPFPFHLLIEPTLEDGAVTAKSPFLDALLPLLKTHQPDAVVGLDMRFLEWWASSVERNLRSRGITDWQSATSSLTYLDGNWPDENTGDIAKALVEEGVRALKQRYEPFGIRLFFMPEEEVGWPTQKQAMYDFFVQSVIRGASLENVCLVDNAVATDATAIDRGKRDSLPVREYNWWNETYMNDALEDGAEIWLYNQGWNRAYPYFMMRLHATAYHQWADQWYDPTCDWTATFPQSDGCLSTLPLEVSTEGMRDFGYFQLLDKYGLDDLRNKFFDCLEISRSIVSKMASKTDEELDAVRWEIVMAVSKAQKERGETPLWEGEDASALEKPANGLVVFPSMDDDTTVQEYVYHAVCKDDSVVEIDGGFAADEWKDCAYAGPFQMTVSEQKRVRAMASSDEEFRQKTQPSGCNFRVAYDSRGLLIAIDANHLNVGLGAKHETDEPEIWADDVFEFFWKDNLDGNDWHLIVNTLGKSALFCNRDLVPNSGVVAAQQDRQNGMRQEILVPWSAMGRMEPPIDGTVWGFNVCRAFWSWKQLSTWAPVFTGFNMGDGQLVFGGFAAKGDMRISATPKTLFPGLNRISITLPATGSYEVELTGVDGETLGEMDCAGGNVFMDVNVPAGKAGTARLFVKTGGSVISEIPLAVLEKSEIQIISVTDTIVIGNDLRAVCMARLPNLLVANETLYVTVFNEKQEMEFEETATLQNGYFHVNLSTDGLSVGTHSMVVSAGPLEASESLQVHCQFTLLPSPWAK